jgi:predicted GNAT family acetyltransferase
VTDTPTVVRNDDTGRFELASAPDDGRLEFREGDGRLTLVHTEVDDRLEGQGVGSALVRAALDHAEREDLTVVPECGFVRSWLDRHPDRADQLDIAHPEGT